MDTFECIHCLYRAAGCQPVRSPETLIAVKPRREAMRQQASSSSVRDRVTPEEWEQRVALAAAYRLVAHFHWGDFIFTHLSARVPGGDHHFLINPYGMTFDEITASSLVKVDIDGNKVMDSPYEINPAGLQIHGAIQPAREKPNW